MIGPIATHAAFDEQPPSIDDGEITDKGYINQRAVIDRRSVHVEELHAGVPEVIRLR